MHQCSDNVPPVIRTIVVDGNEIEICYHGTWADLCRNYVNRLPQNVATLKEGNHAILGNATEDCSRRPSAVVAGHVGGVGHGVRGSEAGQ